MKKNTFLRRLGAMTLSVILSVTAIGANFNISSAAPEQDAAHEAYRKIVQRLVNEKGIRKDSVYKDIESGARVFETGSGVSVAYTLDVTGDGVDELFVGWTAVANEFSPIADILLTYTYKNGEAKIIGRDTPLSDVMLWKNSDKFALVSSNQTHTRGVFIADDTYSSYEISEDAAKNKGTTALDMIFERAEFTSAEEVISFTSGYAGDIGVTFYAYSEKESTMLDLNDSLSQLGVKLPAAPGGDILNSLVYYGDRSKCKMSPEMARAYVNVLRANNDSSYKAVLVDAEGNGMPLLFTSAPGLNGKNVWTFDGQAATRLDFYSKLNMVNYGGFSFGKYNGTPALCIECPAIDPGEAEGTFWFKIENGKLSLMHSVELKWLDITGNKELFVNGTLAHAGADYATYYQELQSHYAPYEESYRLYDIIEGDFTPVGSWTSAYDMAGMLERYISGYSPYANYPKISTENDDYADTAAKLVLDKVKGEIAGIYRLDNGVYYIVIIVDGSERGYLVKGSLKNGAPVFNITEEHETPADAATLDAIKASFNTTSNMSFDYSKIKSLKDIDDVYKYLQSCFDNIDGLSPNDNAKTELVNFIEAALSSICSVKASGKSNRITLTEKQTEKANRKASEARARIDALLLRNGVVLNKPIIINIIVLWKNCNNKKPCQITIENSLLNGLDGNSVQLLLDDNQHYLQFTSQQLEALLFEYQTITIQFAQTDKNKFSVNFLNSEGEMIEKLTAPITIGLPAESSLCTVMASYSGGSDNWGGQFDENSGVLSFETPYSGQYEVTENNIQIDDISELSPESQQAIRFMVSKGYLTLDDNKFLPGEPLSRYQFTKALVGMFFALDRSLVTSFYDVPADNEFYDYVASAEERDIVEGFTSAYFGGERNITVEQMLALAARTLIDQKDYTLPADVGSYITSFEDSDKIGEWARGYVALCVRDGLIERGGILKPNDPITREQAALILYKLFLLLYEIPPVSLENSFPWWIVILAAVFVILIVVFLWIYLKRKKGKN